MNLSDFIDKLIRLEGSLQRTTRCKIELPVYVTHNGFSDLVMGVSVSECTEVSDGEVSELPLGTKYVEVSIG